MIPQNQLQSRSEVKFVGPRHPKDKEILQEGGIFIVECISHRDVLLLLRDDPKLFCRAPLEGGLLLRFVQFDRLTEEIKRTENEMRQNAQDYKSRYRNIIERFNAGQQTEEQKEEARRRGELARKLLALKREREK